MPRYVQGTRPEYAPIDYEHILATVRQSGVRPGSRAYQLADEMVRRARSEHTALSYAHELACWFRFCRAHALDPLKVTRADVDRYAAENGQYAIGTQYLKLLTARLLYKAAVEHGWLRQNPVVIPPSVRRIPETDTPALTRAQLELVLGAIALEFEDPLVGLTAKRDVAMIGLMVRLCLRATETAQLRWGKLVESDGQRRMAFRGKGFKPAVLPVPSDVWETLTKWKRAYERETGTVLGPADPVFLPVASRDLYCARQRGAGASPLRPAGRSLVYQAVARRLRDVGPTGARMSPHALRASGAVLAYHGGATLIEIKELLRHSNMETTMRYLQRLVGGAAASAIAKIELDVPDWTDDAESA